MPARMLPRQSHRLFAGAALALFLTACASAPPEPEPLNFTITAAPDVNPDLQDRPSPVVVHVLELRSAEQFNALDYASLVDPNGTALGNDLLGREQLVMQPGSERQMVLELELDTRAIGVVAGYRDIDNATWRRAVAVTPGATEGVGVTLTRTQVQTSP